MSYPYISPVAKSVYYDDSVTSIGVDNTQDAIEYLKQEIDNINSQEFVIDRFVLSASNVADKKVTLTYTPTASNNVLVNTPNGPIQNLNQDYIIIGNDVSWDGYGLETILEENDILIITYF